MLFGILSDALERQTWREQREATRADLQTLSAERVQLDQAVTELRRTHTTLDTEQANAAKLRDEAASLRRELTDSRAERDSLAKRHDGLLAEIKAAETRIADLEQRRDSAEKQGVDAENRRQSATEAERTARARQTEAEQARNEAISQQKTAEQRAGQLLQDQKTAEQRVSDLRAQETQLTNTVAAAGKEHARLQSDAQRLDAEIKKLDQVRVQLEQDTRTATEGRRNAEVARQEQAQINSTLTTARDALKTAQGQLAETQGQQTALAAEVSRLKTEKDASAGAIREAAEAKAGLDKLLTRQKEAESAVAAAEQNVRQLSTQKTALEADMAKLGADTEPPDRLGERQRRIGAGTKPTGDRVRADRMATRWTAESVGTGPDGQKRLEADMAKLGTVKPGHRNQAGSAEVNRIGAERLKLERNNWDCAVLSWSASAANRFGTLAVPAPTRRAGGTGYGYG